VLRHFGTVRADADVPSARITGMVRKIVQQSIPSGVTASFAASALAASAA
jgi:hypothetical protein